jgi:hypothetical protein
MKRRAWMSRNIKEKSGLASHTVGLSNAHRILSTTENDKVFLGGN